jgi:hypothetical protein
MLAAALMLAAAATPGQSSAGIVSGRPAQTLDRVVAAVGNVAVTASDVESEYRLELFLDGKQPEGDPAVGILDQVRQRLVDRILLEDEVRADGIKVSPDDPSVDMQWSALQKKFPSVEAFATALRKLDISEEEVRQALAGQESILRLIDQRLRPQAVVEPSEIEAYYRGTLVPDLAKEGNQPVPPLGDVESRIREILVQQKIDALLDDWLKRLRSRGDVQLFGSAAAGGST